MSRTPRGFLVGRYLKFAATSPSHYLGARRTACGDSRCHDVRMAYNPDRHPDDLDPNDLEAVDQFLKDPGNVKMWDELGEQFRRLPAPEQLAELEEHLAIAVARRDELAAHLTLGQGGPVQTLHDACVRQVDAITERIVELSGALPEHASDFESE